MTLALLALLIPSAWAQDDVSGETPAEGEELPLLKAPELVEFVQAPYPQVALESKVQATVLLSIEIDELGGINDVKIVRSSNPDAAQTQSGEGEGEATPAPDSEPVTDPAIWEAFDTAALEAAWQFQFTPAQTEQGPIPVIIEFEYGFVLDTEQHQGAIGQEELAQTEQAEVPVNLEGTLLEKGTRRPRPDFAVLVGDQESTTDAEGHFQFRGVPIGSATVVAVQPGYDRAELTVDVVEGQVTDLKVWVRNQAYRDDDLIAVYRKEQEEITRRTLTVQEIKRVPGTFGDPVRVIQNLPGAARSPLGSGMLIIRGSNPEDTGVYVDGVRIPLIYHLGGYESVLNADLIEAVDYLPGGYSVRYGRTMGGAVDVRTKSDFPERSRVVWSTDVLDSGGLYEGRAGKNDGIGVAVAARRSYIDVILPYFLPDSVSVVKPYWWDYQVKARNLHPQSGNSVEVFAFGFKDRLIVQTPEGTSQGTDQDTQGEIGTDYGTHRVLLKYERPLSDSLTFKLTPSIGQDTAAFNVGTELRVEQVLNLGELRAELPWELSDAVLVNPGVDLMGAQFGFAVQFPFDPTNLAGYDPIAEREPWSLEDSGWAFSPDAFLDVKLRPLKDRDRLLLAPGLRFLDMYVTDQYHIQTGEARLAGRLQVTDGGTLKAGTGIYHQPPQPWESYQPSGDIELGFERQWASELGWEHAFSEAITADLTGFYKDMDKLIVTNPDFMSFEDSPFINAGIGRVYGLELMARHALVNHFFGWVSYTLSKSERNDRPTDEDGWYDFEFDQTHILVAVAAYRLPYDFDISGKFSYITGNPSTPYAGGVFDLDQQYFLGYQQASYNSERLPPYQALDLRAEKLFAFNSWQLTLYADLLNVYRGENPEFTVYNYDYTESRYLRGLPFIPSPGFEAEFEF